MSDNLRASLSVGVVYSEGGLTTEQAAQIEANKTAIGDESGGLIKEVNNIKSVIGDSNSGLVKDVADLKANSGTGGSTPVTLTEPYDNDIPRIFLSEGSLPTTKISTTMKFEYISKNKRYSGYVDIKCQGTSSMAYPKKNFTIKIYKDKVLTTKMKINFMNWGEQNKFVLKANWIDLTHARNIVSARLWGDMVKTRENYLELPELLRTSPNSGAIDGFFVKVYANGVYQGRYTMNIPKDKWMTNMDDSLNEHCILCGENYQSGLFRATAQINGTDWSDELHDIVPTSIVNRWNQVINFVMSSSDSEFKANIGQYFDLTSLIDYYIFAYVSCGLDSMGKNQIYMTYDGQKWFASMYDMDSTWGLYWNGQNFVSASYRMQNDYESGKDGNGGNLLYLRLEQTFINEIKERYIVLRNGVLSETNIINSFEEFMICNSDLIKEDYEIFSSIPSQNTNNIKQIRQYVVDRCKYVDRQINDYTALDVSTIQKGQPFTLYDGALDLDNQTLFADIILDDSSALQNVLSVGKTIDDWMVEGSTNLHFYYPKSLEDSNRVLRVQFTASGHESADVAITNNALKIALNANGIYVNSIKLNGLYQSTRFTSFIAQKILQIGSLEGVKNSNSNSKATYNRVGIYNRLLSNEELVALTSMA